MFTGIIAALGQFDRIEPKDGGLDVLIESPFTDLIAGESIAVNGVCLTVTSFGAASFTVHVVRTTLDRTLFESFREGDPLNLERALRANDRLGGHFVQGHVDGIGEVTGMTDHDDARLIDITVPAEVARLSFPRGSIAVDGVSMTVNEILEPGVVQLSVVPYTIEHTTLGRLGAGDRVHLEADMLGKFVEHLTSWQTTTLPEQ